VKTIAKIIEIYGGLEWLRQPGSYIRLENPPYMRLVIEYVGEGPRGMPSISVAHYYEQNGDAMRDPEMLFEVSPDEGGSLKKRQWSPVSFQQDNLGIYREVVFVNDTDRVMVRPNLFLDLKPSPGSGTGTSNCKDTLGLPRPTHRPQEAVRDENRSDTPRFKVHRCVGRPIDRRMHFDGSCEHDRRNCGLVALLKAAQWVTLVGRSARADIERLREMAETLGFLSANNPGTYRRVKEANGRAIQV
jgi:hypothetical protein